MIEIALNQVGKRFNFNWIFKGVSVKISSDEPLVILGSNGSGKSTFLSILAGASIPSEGEIHWKLNNVNIEETSIYQHVSIAAPYLELIEEFTLQEHLNFHFSVKPLLQGVTKKDLLGIVGLEKAADRRISYFSSGMRQRLKLALAILSDTEILLLDEPLSNLDKKAATWYDDLIKQFGNNRVIVVCSNHQYEEYAFCKQSLSIEDFR
jgi:ABC-type multidrug transport system ATPase subunit